MAGILQLMRADVRKLTSTPFFVLHLAVPVVGAVTFLSYLALTDYAAESMTGVYLQAIALVFPLIVAWVCSIAADQETEASGGFFLLVAVSRARALASKLIVVVFLGLLSCVLAVFLFAGGASLLQPDYVVSWGDSFVQALILWASALFLYMLHLWVSLRFGRNVNFALAAFELLLAALMLTGLGDTIWFAVPCAWGIRMVSAVTGATSAEFSMVQATLPLAVVVAVVLTLAAVAFLFWWMPRWGGRKNEEE